MPLNGRYTVYGAARDVFTVHDAVQGVYTVCGAAAAVTDRGIAGDMPFIGGTPVNRIGGRLITARFQEPASEQGIRIGSARYIQPQKAVGKVDSATLEIVWTVYGEPSRNGQVIEGSGSILSTKNSWMPRQG